MNMISREDATIKTDNNWAENVVVFNKNIPEGESIYIYDGIISQQY
jgi:hypothetical protein